MTVINAKRKINKQIKNCSTQITDIKREKLYMFLRRFNKCQIMLNKISSKTELKCRRNVPITFMCAEPDADTFELLLTRFRPLVSISRHDEASYYQLYPIIRPFLSRTEIRAVAKWIKLLLKLQKNGSSMIKFTNFPSTDTLMQLYLYADIIHDQVQTKKNLSSLKSSELFAKMSVCSVIDQIRDSLYQLNSSFVPAVLLVLKILYDQNLVKENYKILQKPKWANVLVLTDVIKK